MSVQLLNSFLRGEMSAVETYRMALDRLQGSVYAQALQDCMRSHQRRVDMLREQVQLLGGEPAKDSGVWGALARMVEGGAKGLGDKAAVAALEEGEDHGRDEYDRDVHRLDPMVRGFVEKQILPEQERTHAVISQMKRQMAHPA